MPPFPSLTWLVPVFIGRWTVPAESSPGEPGGGGDGFPAFYLFGSDGAPLLSPVDGDLLQPET